MSLSQAQLTQLKRLFRQKFPVKAGGPADKARAAGAIASLDALADALFNIQAGAPADVTVQQLQALLGAGAGIQLTLENGKLIITNSATVEGPLPVSKPPIVAGFLPAKGSEGTNVTITGSRFTDVTAVSFNGTPAIFQPINATTLQAVVPVGATTGPVSVSTDSATGTSAASFTVGATATPQPAAPKFSGFDDVNNTVSVAHDTLDVSELLYDFGGATGLSVPLNNVISVGNAAGQVTAYARATSTRPEGLRARSQPFTITQANNAPTVGVSSPQAGQTLNVGDPVVLNLDPQDADGAQDIKKVEVLDNGQVFNTLTASPWTVQRILTGGAHSFTARVYDMVGAQGLSNTVQVTAQSGGTATTLDAVHPVGQSNDNGLSDRSQVPQEYYNTNLRALGYDFTIGSLGTFSLGSLDGNGNVINANDHAITKILVPSYPNGVGPVTGYVKRWLERNAGNSKNLLALPKDLTPPVSTNSATTFIWLNDYVDGNTGQTMPALIKGWKNEITIAYAAAKARGITQVNPTIFLGLGEGNGDSIAAGKSTAQDYYDGMKSLITQMLAHLQAQASSGFTIGTVNLGIVLKQQPRYASTIVPVQRMLLKDFPTAKAVDLTPFDPTTGFIEGNNGTHYKTPQILALGEQEADMVADGWVLTPTLDAVAPTSQQVGQSVQLTGTNFKTGAVVKFGTVTASTVTVVSDTVLTAVVPSGAGTTITVTTVNGTSNGVAFSVGAPQDIYPWQSSEMLAQFTSDTSKTNGNYVTSRRDGNFALSALAGLYLPANTEGGFRFRYIPDDFAIGGFATANANQGGASYSMANGSFPGPPNQNNPNAAFVRVYLDASTSVVDYTLTPNALYCYLSLRQDDGTYLLRLFEEPSIGIYNIVTGFGDVTNTALYPQLKLPGLAAGVLHEVSCWGMVPV